MARKPPPLTPDQQEALEKAALRNLHRFRSGWDVAGAASLRTVKAQTIDALDRRGFIAIDMQRTRATITDAGRAALKAMEKHHGR